MSRPSAQQVPVPKFDVSSFAVSNLFVPGATIAQFCCGVDHYALVDKSGSVSTFGRNRFSQLGLINAGEFVPVPTPVGVLGFQRVAQVACGWDFTLFLTDDGELVGCGSNPYVNGGNTGTGGPTAIKWNGAQQPISKIAAGMGHALALTKSGYVLSSGQNLAGQLGHNAANQPYFTAIDSRVFVDIACGGYHSAILQADGTLHTAGWDCDGQLGLADKPKTKLFLPVLLPSAVAGVSCGFEHTVALCVDGTVWAWGRNHRGQLGVGDREDRHLPKRVLGAQEYEVKRVVAGREFSALVTARGDVLMCGAQDPNKDSDLQVATPVGRFPHLLDTRVDCALTSAARLVDRKQETTKDADVLLTGLEQTLKSCLECPICFATMSAPIRMCKEGHSVCDKCRLRTEVCATCRKPYSATRNVTLESLVSEVSLGCEECPERMCASELERHAFVCPARQQGCPLGVPCEWRGGADCVWAHAASAHPQETWTAPHVFVQSAPDNARKNVLAAFGRAFLVGRQYSEADRALRVTVQSLGSDENEDKLKFSLEIISPDNGTNFTFKTNVRAKTETAFTSANSVSVTCEVLDMFLQDNQLVCEINVWKPESSARDDIVKSLLAK